MLTLPSEVRPNWLATDTGSTPLVVLLRLRKSPASSAAVGISAVEVTKSWRQRGSKAKKKKLLFLPLYQCLPPSPNFGRTMGPPTVSETWLERRLLRGRGAVPMVNGVALNFGLR